MKKFFHDKDGNFCAAKTVFMLSFFVCLVKIMFSNMTFGAVSFGQVDYTGMAAFLSPLMAAYLGRSYTKASIKNV